MTQRDVGRVSRSTDRLIESRYTKSMPPNTDPRSSEMTGGRRGHRSDNKQVMSVDNTGSKSVKIARRELRAMSTEEVSTRRRSNLNNGSVDSQMKFLNSSNHHFNGIPIFHSGYAYALSVI